MAMPLGIIGHTFTEIWKDRDRVLLRRRLLDRLRQTGYGADDVHAVFDIFDRDRNGSVDFREFRRMLHAMNLGLRDERALQLFNMFDIDSCGFVTAQEFLKTLFPKKFLQLIEEHEDPCDTEGQKCEHVSPRAALNGQEHWDSPCILLGQASHKL